MSISTIFSRTLSRWRGRPVEPFGIDEEEDWIDDTSSPEQVAAHKALVEWLGNLPGEADEQAEGDGKE
jgi:hypothetical protein